MVSNGYSKRRGPLRRPKVCKASPNPGRCHPPPPWPPHTFTFDFECTYMFIFFPQTFDWSLQVSKLPAPDWWWQGIDVAPDRRVDFNVHDVNETVRINVTGTDSGLGPYELELAAFPLIWGVSTSYIVIAWDFMSPNIISATARFTF